MVGKLLDEQLMVQVLRCFIEEWGPDNVIVNVPRVWQDDVEVSSLGRVRLAFENEDRCLSIRAGGDEPVVERKFLLELQSPTSL
jgi:hypothetical protein